MSAVEAFFDACRQYASYEPPRGERVQLLTFSHSAIPGMNCEVREADNGRRLPRGLFWGSKKQCLQYMADKGLDCLNLDAWGERLPPASLFD